MLVASLYAVYFFLKYYLYGNILGKSTLHLSQLYFLSSYTLKVYLLNNSSHATRYQVHFVVCLSCFSIQGLHKFSVLHVRGVWLLGCASKVA